jgi:hypothetical protein
MQWLLSSTFNREMHRPSAANVWQQPPATALPIPFLPGLSTPDDVQAASYLALSARIVSLFIKSKCFTCHDI